jgi:hypothetical protein
MHKELPIKSKLQMLEDIAEALHLFQQGEKAKLEAVLQNLKVRSVYLEEPIQQATLIFIEQVLYHFGYDRLLDAELQRSADRLIEELGFTPPEKLKLF